MTSRRHARWQPFLALVLLVSCSRQLAVYPIDYEMVPKEPVAAGCKAGLLYQSEGLSGDCIPVGDVFVGDTGWSTSCDWERVTTRLAIEACQLGGNMALVREVEDPTLTCYQARALVFRCPTDAKTP